MAYIYLITNNVNGKFYVGKTEDTIEKRFQKHCSDSKKERCKNRPLYRAMNKYGCENFSVSLLEETDQPEIREIYWIEQKQSYHNGYNATLGGDGKKYLDYDLVYATYCNLKNAVQTAIALGISKDSVLKIVNKYEKTKSTAEVNKEYFGKEIKMYSLEGTYEQTFKTLREAAAFLQQNNFTAITKAPSITQKIKACADGVRKTAFKKVWHW